MADLTTVEAVKRHMPNPPASDPELELELARLVSAASDEFIGAVGWPVVAGGNTVEVRDGDGGRRMLLQKAGPLERRATPPLSLVSVEVDDEAVPPRATSSGDGHVFDAELGAVELVGRAFTRGTKNVRLTYTFGYAAAAVPKDIEQAVIEAVLLAQQRRGMGGAGQVIEGGTVIDMRGNVPMFAHAQGIVDAYRLAGGVG